MWSLVCVSFLLPAACIFQLLGVLDLSNFLCSRAYVLSTQAPITGGLAKWPDNSPGRSICLSTLSVHLSVSLFICPSVSLSVCPSLCSVVHSSVCSFVHPYLSVSLSVWPSVHLFVHLSIDCVSYICVHHLLFVHLLSVHQSFCPSICFVCLSITAFFHASVCLSVLLSISPSILSVHQSQCHSICLSIHLCPSVSLSTCLPISLCWSVFQPFLYCLGLNLVAVKTLNICLPSEYLCDLGVFWPITHLADLKRLTGEPEGGSPCWQWPVCFQAYADWPCWQWPVCL